MCCLEVSEPSLSATDIIQEVEVIIEEVCRLRQVSAINDKQKNRMHVHNWVTLTRRFTLGSWAFSSSSGVTPRR